MHLLSSLHTSSEPNEAGGLAVEWTVPSQSWTKQGTPISDNRTLCSDSRGSILACQAWQVQDMKTVCTVPLVWIEISALTDQCLTPYKRKKKRKKTDHHSAVSSQQTVECMFPGVRTPLEAIRTSIFSLIYKTIIAKIY